MVESTHQGLMIGEETWTPMPFCKEHDDDDISLLFTLLTWLFVKFID